MSQTIENNVTQAPQEKYEYNRRDIEKERLRAEQEANNVKNETPPEDPDRGSNVNKLV